MPLPGDLPLVIQHVERTDRRFFIHVHGSSPKPAERVALAIIESGGWKMRFRIFDRCQVAGCRIEHGESRLQSAQQRLAVRAGPDAANAFGQSRHFFDACGGIEVDDFASLDIDPEQVITMPDWAFTKDCPGLTDGFGSCGVHGPMQGVLVGSF